MININDFVLNLHSVIAHSQLENPRDITLLTGLPGSGKTTLIEYLSYKEVDLKKEYQPTLFPDMKWIISRYDVCECPFNEKMLMRFALAFAPSIRGVIFTLDVNTLKNAELIQKHSSFADEVMQLIPQDHSDSSILFAFTKTDQLPKNSEDFSQYIPEENIKFLENITQWHETIPTNVTQDRKISYPKMKEWLENQTPMNSGDFNLNINDEPRQQFESAFLDFLNTEIKKLTETPTKTPLWKNTLAICRIMKTGGRLQAHQPELLKAAETFIEQYYLLTHSLRDAVRAKTSDVLEILIKHGIDVNQKYKETFPSKEDDHEETTALYEATLIHRKESPKEEHVKLLLQAGANPYEKLMRRPIDDKDEKEKYTTNPFQVALRDYSPELFPVFLEYGADINQPYQDKTGETYFSNALYLTSKARRLGLREWIPRQYILNGIWLMLKHKANIKHIHPDRSTVLMDIVAIGDTELIKAFLEQGALETLHNVNQNGMNALMYSPTVEIVELLRSYGAMLTEDMSKVYDEYYFNKPEIAEKLSEQFIVRDMQNFVLNMKRTIEASEGDYLKDIYLVTGLSGSGKTNLVKYLLHGKMDLDQAHQSTESAEVDVSFRIGTICDCLALDLADNKYSNMSMRFIAALARSILGVIVTVDINTLKDTTFTETYSMLAMEIESMFPHPRANKSIFLALTKSDLLPDFLNNIPPHNASFIQNEMNSYSNMIINVEEGNAQRQEILTLLHTLQPIRSTDLNINSDDEPRKKFEHDFMIFLKYAMKQIKEKPEKSLLWENTLVICNLMKADGRLKAHKSELLKIIDQFVTQYHSLTSTFIDAAYSRSPDILKILIDHGHDVNEIYRNTVNNKTTILLNMTMFHHKDASKITHLRLALQAGADPYARIHTRGLDGEPYIMTPLDEAVRTCQFDLLAVYFECGANPNYQYIDEVGKTYFSEFIHTLSLYYDYHLRGTPETIQVLLDHGANVNHIDPNGISVLMYIARYGDIQFVNQFFEKGAIKTLNHTNQEGISALFYASNLGVVQLLLLKGATFNEDIVKKYDEYPRKNPEIAAFFKAKLNMPSLEDICAQRAVLRLSVPPKPIEHPSQGSTCQIL